MEHSPIRNEPVERITQIWGERTPLAAGQEWPVRVDQCLEEGIDESTVSWSQSACVLCSNGCGVDVAVHEGRIVGVRGRADDHVNRGRLGPKGLFGWQANNAPDRLTTPLVRRDGELHPATWDEAMSLVVERSRDVLAEHGPLAMGFYNSGQLFLEDYYTLAVMVRAGIGTPHLDGNTRLCTATSDFALKQSFGSDGNPGTMDDVDLCDTLFLVGHNMAETHTVLWSRVLDRLSGPDRPRIIVVDPRLTAVAAQADVHLPVLPGTNLVLLNAILHGLIEAGSIDEEFVSSHTVGFEKLRKIVARYPVERAAEICGVRADDIRAAIRLIGESERLVSTALQGVYQSHLATATACQINNIHLLRGMIGKPGCTVFQMNGQPTAQNTREAGADGDLMGLRNWQNVDHVAELARLWHVDVLDIPTWSPPTHAMQIFRYAEEGSIRFLWIIGTNPAMSLPDLSRIRSILGQERLFVVVSDAFLNETVAFADVVLPAALWGEKTGTFTNHDRTVHLSEQAVEPPGEARPDMDIFLDYARRLDLRNRDGDPLIPWHTPEECFDAFKEATRGRPGDYSGLSYAKLRRRSGYQWPVDEDHPDGTPRLYTDHHFNTETDYTRGVGPRPRDRRRLREEGPRRAAGRTAEPSSTPRSGHLRTNRRPRTIPSSSRPAGRSTSSIPGRRPGGFADSTTPRRRPGSRSHPRTRRPSTSPTATWCPSSRRGDGWNCVPDCRPCVPVSCSLRSTTATGTTVTTVAIPRRPRVRPTN